MMNWESRAYGGTPEDRKARDLSSPALYIFQSISLFSFSLSFYFPCQLFRQHLILLLYTDITMFFGNLTLAWIFPDLNSKSTSEIILLRHCYTWRIWKDLWSKGWRAEHGFPIWEVTLPILICSSHLRLSLKKWFGDVRMFLFCFAFLSRFKIVK